MDICNKILILKTKVDKPFKSYSNIILDSFTIDRYVKKDDDDDNDYKFH